MRLAHGRQTMIEQLETRCMLSATVGVYERLFVEQHQSGVESFNRLGRISYGQDVSQTYQGFEIANTGDNNLVLSDIVQKPSWVTVVDGITGAEQNLAPYDQVNNTGPMAVLRLRLSDNTPVGVYSGFVWFNTNDPSLPDDPSVTGVDHFFKLYVSAEVLSGTGTSLGVIASSPVTTPSTNLVAVRQIDYNGRYIDSPGAQLLGFQLNSPMNGLTFKMTAGPAGVFSGGGVPVSGPINYRIFGDDGDLAVEPNERSAGGPAGSFARDGVQHTAVHNLKAGKYLIELIPPTNPDASEQTPYSVTLSATALPVGKAIIRGNGTVINDGSNSTSTSNYTDFGSANTGTTGPIRTFVLKNEGNANLTVTSIGVQGSDFIALTPKPASPLAPGATLNIQVQMLTASAGAKTSRLVVGTDDPLTSSYDFKLVGNVVTPPNPVPTINSFLCDPSPFSAGAVVTLRATASDSNGSVTGVEIFIDKNNNGSADAGESLGVDGPRKGYWKTCNTTGYGGSVAFLAQAIDNNGARSGFSKIVTSIVNKNPVISSFTASSSSVVRGNPLTLFASASDSDGSVKSVSFFWDQNKNGLTDAGELLGTDGPAKGFKFSVNSANLPRGINTFLAIASDNLTASSKVAKVSVQVNKA